MPITPNENVFPTRLVVTATHAGTEDMLSFEIPQPIPGGGRLWVDEAVARELYQDFTNALTAGGQFSQVTATLVISAGSDVTPDTGGCP